MTRTIKRPNGAVSVDAQIEAVRQEAYKHGYDKGYVEGLRAVISEMMQKVNEARQVLPVAKRRR